MIPAFKKFILNVNLFLLGLLTLAGLALIKYDEVVYIHKVPQKPLHKHSEEVQAE